MPSQRRVCERALQWLQRAANTNFHFSFSSLPNLLCCLMESAPTPAVVPTVNIASEHLSRDVFLYTSGVLCRYHETIDCCQ